MKDELPAEIGDQDTVVADNDGAEAARQPRVFSDRDIHVRPTTEDDARANGEWVGIPVGTGDLDDVHSQPVLGLGTDDYAGLYGQMLTGLEEGRPPGRVEG